MTYDKAIMDYLAIANHRKNMLKNSYRGHVWHTYFDWWGGWVINLSAYIFIQNAQ